ncbi:hypothetical protein Tco_1002745 [Tanacetum coccineum]|uniref:Uncharacterized protein n=1 Tax=Tanacetum coccineum TaxID=301880 RepID=A0ABQ5F9F4_9ASTR
MNSKKVPAPFSTVKTVEFGKLNTIGPLSFHFLFLSSKELSKIARLVPGDVIKGNLAKDLGFDWGLTFLGFGFRIVTWRLYESCGVCILEFEDGIVIHMLVERRYPLSKDLLQMMPDLGLEVERESSVALDLIIFIKQQINEE